METTVANRFPNNSIKNGSDQIPWTFNEKVMIIISYSTSISLSLFGNVVVIIVFWLGTCRPNRNNEVRQFLTNLAVSDLLISLFCVPFTFTYILLWDWPFPYLFCPVVLSIQLLAVTASSITNMVIGLDRFWVVIYPMKSRITRKRSGLVIGCIWVSSILFSSVQCFVSRASIREGGYTECSENWNNNNLQISYTISILLITYFLPLIVLTVTYTIVGIKLWKRSLPGEADEIRDAKHMKSKVKVIKMLSIIVICFGLCWLPLHLFFVVTHVNQSQGYTKNLNIAYVVCHWIAMSNSFVNPVVYSFMNDSFKSDFRWLVYHKCCGLCQRQSWSRKINFNTTSARNSVSNNFSPALTIQNRKYNDKFPSRDHSSPERSKEIQFLFNKDNNECVNHNSIDLPREFQVKSKPLSTNMNKIKILILDAEVEKNRIFTNQNYQIITQL